MSYKNANQLGIEHTEWLKSLDFYEQELDILEERLAEVGGKNNSIESRSGLEHFQNQFIIQRNNISRLKHSIKANDHQVYVDVKEHMGKAETSRFDDHGKIAEDVRVFENIIRDLRQEFNVYLAKWM